MKKVFIGLFFLFVILSALVVFMAIMEIERCESAGSIINSQFMCVNPRTMR